jgi:hypothetical protein
MVFSHINCQRRRCRASGELDSRMWAWLCRPAPARIVSNRGSCAEKRANRYRRPNSALKLKGREGAATALAPGPSPSAPRMEATIPPGLNALPAPGHESHARDGMPASKHLCGAHRVSELLRRCTDAKAPPDRAYRVHRARSERRRRCEHRRNQYKFSTYKRTNT